MSERDDELELEALQRELDDAFATTRPRRGFEDELWTRMQSSRPATNRFREAIAGLLQRVRAAPAVPAAAIATILVLAIGVGLLSTVRPHVGGAGGAASLSEQRNSAGSGAVSQDLASGAFGRLPSPVFDNSPKAAAPTTVGSSAQYLGPVRYVWAGTTAVGTATAPVYRYREPSTSDADRLASSLGAVLRERAPGLLGSYSASTYTLNVLPTIQHPATSPTYFMIATPSMPAIDAVGAPDEVATVFLAQHSLMPDWSHAIAVDSGGDLLKVRYERQFGVGGYGEAFLVDGNGQRFGIEVDLKANRPILVTGMLPVSLDAAEYRLATPQIAIAPVTDAQPSSAPTVQLTDVQLVYVLVPAGDHSFYEPAYLFSGKVLVQGVTYTRQLLVAAVDPSQRNQ